MNILQGLISTNETTPTDPAQLFLDYLKLEGYSPVLDGDGDLRFQRNDLTYYIQFDRKDPEFFRLILPNIWSLDSMQERQRAYAAADSANARCKAAKVFVVKDHVWATIEMFLASQDQARPVIERCMNSLQRAMITFSVKMQEA